MRLPRNRDKGAKPEPKAVYARKKASFIKDAVTCIEFQLGVDTKPEMNQRGHWAIRKRRFDTQALAFKCLVASRHIAVNPFPSGCDYRITLTRLSSRHVDDDNLASAFKAIRDAVADWLGIDDGSDRISWQYAQEKSKNRGVRIRIERIEP